MITVTTLMVTIYKGSFWRPFKSACFLNKKGLYKNMSLLISKPRCAQQILVYKDLIKHFPFPFVFYGTFFLMMKSLHDICKTM